MSIDIKPMNIADYNEVAHLWQNTEGVGLHHFEDSREGIMLFLNRNPDMSFIARHDGKLVGAVLCGHDGRRGSINHLAVAEEYRRQGIGRSLVSRCLLELRLAGIRKCNIVVFAGNGSRLETWKRLGWIQREDLVFMQSSTDIGGIDEDQ
ncbi:MAG: GNAT family N-acetyltransferase [Armatimonadota bacterium]